LARVQVRGGQLWGTDIYTDDSDLVAGMYPNESYAIIIFVWPEHDIDSGLPVI